jgi:glutaredoxin-like protein NrdH
MAIIHVEGDNKGNIMLYTLSTCGWCRKTKALLRELNVAFDYEDVDLLEKNEKDKAMSEVRKWNPACSFPSLVIDGKQCIVGFQEEKIREALKP